MQSLYAAPVMITLMLCWFSTWMLLTILEAMHLESTPRTNRLLDATRIVSLVHNSLAGPYSIYLLLGWPAHVDGITTAYGPATWMLAISLGYFIWDTLVSLIMFRTIKVDMLLHAMVCTLGTYLAMKPLFQYESIGFLVFECSTPFLNLFRLAQAFKCNNRLQLTFGIVFAFSFFVFRMMWGTVFVLGYTLPHIYQLHSQGDIGSPLACVCYAVSCMLFLLNCYWFRSILRMGK